MLSSARSDRRATAILAVLIAAVTLALGLAACGGGAGGGNGGETTVAEGGKAEGELVFSNWPGYIDPGKNGTIAEFEDKTGIKVDYIEDINSNDSFFGKLQPQLEQGQSGGRSLFVVADYMAEQMHDLGYLQEIEKDDLPTVFENILPSLKSPEFDPERKFSVPWQGGMTGIWVDTSKAPEIKSVNDLFDPKYKGKVTMLDELRETPALVMLAEGVDPAKASADEWLAAIDKIKSAADSGQIRRFTGNDYTEDLTAGNIVAAIGWSGDASLIENPNAEWRMPTEGCVRWSENMVIPVGAPNTAAAIAFMNFVYRPEVAADITEWVEYISPVDGVKPILEKNGSELAESEIVFPSDEFTRNCTGQNTPPELDQVNEAWQNVLTG
ncbi:MAG TPA: spermidine/putrescine ABC transporter substrate-binding protein [Solirubrobacterales bacterium]|jgi:spermidine/putrescine transport system substrate-binding protein|nr:spermidine/putrescine ABC transporter substrate-binding protein [Solirubrobacterales bacterium]